MSRRRRFSYHDFFLALELFIFRAAACLVAIGWVLDHVAKELWPNSFFYGTCFTPYEFSPGCYFARSVTFALMRA